MFLILLDKPKNCETNKNGCIIPYHQHYIFLIYVSLKMESKKLKPWLECKNSIISELDNIFSCFIELDSIFSCFAELDSILTQIQKK